MCDFTELRLFLIELRKMGMPFDEILEEKRKRHIDSFIKAHRDELELTSGANNIIYKYKEQK